MFGEPAGLVRADLGRGEDEAVAEDAVGDVDGGFLAFRRVERLSDERLHAAPVRGTGDRVGEFAVEGV